MPPRKGHRDAYHHGRLREGLLDAAERSLEREGAPSLALRAIAREAGVTHAAAYHHFADREALLRAVAARGFERLSAALTARARRGAGPFAFLEMGVGYVAFAAQHPALFRLMFSGDVARGRSTDAALRAASDGAFAVLLGGARLLDRAAPDEVVRRHAVRAWSIVHGLAGLLLDDQLAMIGLSIEDHERIAREVLIEDGPPGEGR